MDHQPLDESQRTTGIEPISTLALHEPIPTGGLSWDGNRTKYLYAGDRLAVQLDWSEGESPVRKFVAVDHLNSTRAVVSDDGGDVTAEKIDYYPFGGFITGDPVPDTTHLFTGHERDTAEFASNLDYMHARYFSPNLGRFLSVDPIGGEVGSSQSWNRYSYVLNNPLTFVDPTGEEIQIDNEDDLNLLQHALDDEDLASQLTMETVTEEHSFLGIFNWTTSNTVVSNAGADWSTSSNPNAQLIDAAIDTDTQISFSVTDRNLSYAGGAVTNTIAFSSANRIAIEINPGQVLATRVPGPNDQPVGVPVGIAVVHEFGHAWGNFEKGVYGGPGAGAVGANTDRYAVNWENLARQRYFTLRNRPYVPRTSH